MTRCYDILGKKRDRRFFSYACVSCLGDCSFCHNIEMATVVRQIKRHQASDWYTDTYAKFTNAEHQLSATGELRQEARFLRNETDCQTKWDQYSSDVRLADRIDHVRQWKELLQRTLEKLDQEISELSEAKEACEHVMEVLNLRTDISIECLTLREGRRNIEVVQDQPEDQLHKEMEVTDGLKKTLQQRISDAFEQLCLLQEVRHQVQTNLQDKSTAIDIDIDQYNLSDRSPKITFKPDALRTPKGSTTIQQWDEFSRSSKGRVDVEMKSSNTLREQIRHTLQQATSELEAQKEATEFAFRKRMHESQQAKDELQWLKKNTEESIADLENDIRGIQESIRNKNRSMMKAQTRLENRTYRSNMELCCDAAHFGLVDETRQLAATINALEEKLKQAQHSLDGLYKSLQHLTDDIVLKTQTLSLDGQCMGIRQKMNPPAKGQTENNLRLTGIERMKLATLT